MKRAVVIVTLAVLGALAGGCSRTVPPHATAADAERGHVVLADLQEGRALLVRKCGSCHQPPLPAAHVKLDWPKLLDEMATRATLDERQRALILQYLVVMTDSPPPPSH